MTQHFFFRSFFFEHLPFCAFAKHFDAPFLSLHAASTDASAMNSITTSSNLLMTAMGRLLRSCYTPDALLSAGNTRGG